MSTRREKEAGRKPGRKDKDEVDKEYEESP
jgi:hypothetical protein